MPFTLGSIPDIVKVYYLSLYSNVFSSLKSDEWGSKFDIEEEYDMVECMEGGEETSSTEDFISIEDYEGWEEEVEEEKKVINSVRTPFRRLGMGRRWSGSLDEEEEKPQQQWQHQQQKEKDEGDKMTFKRAQEPHRKGYPLVNSFKVTVYLQIGNFHQIWIFGFK